MKTYDLVIVGGGPAGMFAATQARKRGIDRILIIERGKELGGMLNQCIHSGFGTGEFDKELTGTEFAYKMLQKIEEMSIEYKVETSVFSIKDKEVSMVSQKNGIEKIASRAIVLATGAMERPRGSMNILGNRMAGIFTAGSIQRFINEQGVLPGRKIVILGSRDIGMVVARQLKIEGADIIGVYEFRKHVGGTEKVFNRCIKDFDIPIYLKQTVIGLNGDERLQGVYVAEVDEKNRFIDGTEKYISCDTLILSVGLEPIHDLPKKMSLVMNDDTKSPCINNDYETSEKGVFVCGNALHIHDYIDNIREESKECVKSVVKYLNHEEESVKEIDIDHDGNIKYLIPKRIKVRENTESGKKNFTLKIKVKELKSNAELNIFIGEKNIYKERIKNFTPSETKWLYLSEAMFASFGEEENIYVSIEEMKE